MFITGSLHAVRDLWMIGDCFLYKVFNVLPELKSKATNQNKTGKVPYVYDYFNVTSYMTDPMNNTQSVYARILNSLLKALNDATKLPRINLLIPDQDILDDIDYSHEGKSIIMGGVFEWLVNQVQRAITSKKEDMRNIRPGAVIVNEPKTIWLKMLQSPQDDVDLFNAQKHYNFLHQFGETISSMM